MSIQRRPGLSVEEVEAAKWTGKTREQRERDFLRAHVMVIAVGVPKPPTYYVVRMFKDEDKGDQVIKRGLSLEEAQAHCRRADTHGDGWFDGYEEEK